MGRGRWGTKKGKLNRSRERQQSYINSVVDLLAAHQANHKHHNKGKSVPGSSEDTAITLNFAEGKEPLSPVHKMMMAAAGYWHARRKYQLTLGHGAKPDKDGNTVLEPFFLNIGGQVVDVTNVKTLLPFMQGLMEEPNAADKSLQELYNNVYAPCEEEGKQEKRSKDEIAEFFVQEILNNSIRPNVYQERRHARVAEGLGMVQKCQKNLKNATPEPSSQMAVEATGKVDSLPPRLEGMEMTARPAGGFAPPAA